MNENVTIYLCFRFVNTSTDQWLSCAYHLVLAFVDFFVQTSEAADSTRDAVQGAVIIQRCHYIHRLEWA